MRVFSREFQNLDNPLLDDLVHLEREGAIYAQFWRDDLQDFRFCRIQFTPKEIVDYVDATVAFDEFLGLLALHGDPSVALSQISDAKVRERVKRYNDWTISIGQSDTAFCYAAFLGSHLEDLVTGALEDRYEFMSLTYTGDRRFILTEVLEMFPSSAAFLSGRGGNRPPYTIEKEQDVRDLLYAMLKAVFPDARLEEHTRKHAGSAKRIDIVIPAISTVIEVKYVRNHSHAKKVADELRIDFESYHVHPHCKKLIAYVWDPDVLLVDRLNFINDLRGLRVKGNSRFSVDIMVKP